MYRTWSGSEDSSHTNLYLCVPFSLGDFMDEKYMLLAIQEAIIAKELDEVPIGCVIIKNGEIIGKGHNLRERLKLSVAHAEIMAIEDACKKLGAWQLVDCDLYVTLEPCPMCAGAIMQSRIKNVYFGAYDPKGGSYGSNFNLNEVKKLNHYPNVKGGILENECSKILKDFFKEKRKK